MADIEETEDSRNSTQLRDIVEEVVNRTVPEVVHHTLLAIGINPASPLEAQNDMVFLRSMRTRCEKIGMGATLALITITVGGVMSVFVIGFKEWMHSLLFSGGGG